MKMKNLRTYKQYLQEKVKILEPGIRLKDFSYPIFEKLSKEYQITSETQLKNGEIRTAICYAGDINRNFVEPYILKKINQKHVHVSPVNNHIAYASFYIDAVAIIPEELMNSRLKLELLTGDEKLDKMKKKTKVTSSPN